ncbi:permease [Anaeroselena agilis]|uniref:Permease n=1 Tax=Anaeroselena agilis TaxID=3063788 RepID=A0ABU3NU25_9FIRM|nr:permease [Selenomonadales bacterium 4137-cl]
MAILKRYKWALLLLIADGAIYAWNHSLGMNIFMQTSDSFVQMLSFIPPVFIILGLLDTWVPREQVVSHLGPGTGIKGMALAILLGVANAGPLYAAFPVAAVMLKKGTSLFNVIVFIGAWATLKVPMFLFETQFLGGLFSVTRWICSLTGIILIAFVIDRLLSDAEKQAIYAKH